MDMAEKASRISRIPDVRDDVLRAKSNELYREQEVGKKLSERYEAEEYEAVANAFESIPPAIGVALSNLIVEKVKYQKLFTEDEIRRIEEVAVGITDPLIEK